MSRVPLRVRLTLVFATAMACVLAATGVFVYVRVGDTLGGTVDASLRAQAAESAHDVGEGKLVDRDAAQGARLAQLLTPDGAIARSSAPGLPPVLGRHDAARVAAGADVLRSVHVPGRAGDWRLLAVAARDEGAPRVLVLLAPLAAREETLHRLFVEFLVVGPIALVLASLAGYGVAAAALRPVESMRRRAAAITATTAGTRLPLPGSHDEIGRLAETLNAMLDRLEGALEHERRFVADASHELRTPLALLRTELEVALRRPRSNAELEDALRSAAEESERLARLTEELLLIARSDQGQLPLVREDVAVGELLDTVAARFAERAARDERAVVVDGVDGATTVPADRARLEGALANLVENALVHGAGTVRLSAERRSDLARVRVHDEGTGFPAAFVPRAFDRFSRADEARGRPGSGLGLSIVDLVARAHGGAAHVASRAGGGTDVWIELPLSQHPHSKR
jgi:two-component system OmpR family sensor kinase